SASACCSARPARRTSSPPSRRRARPSCGTCKLSSTRPPLVSSWSTPRATCSIGLPRSSPTIFSCSHEERPMNIHTTKRALLSSAGALLIATAAVGGYAWQQNDRPRAAGPTVTAHRGTLVETASASGKIEPDVQVDVKSRGSGQVIEVLVKEGEQVQAGQLLVK